jgi:hypothetical protein
MEDKGGEIGIAGKDGGEGERKREKVKQNGGAGELAPKTQNPNSAYVVDHL